MAQERPVRVERKLSAILAADGAGYSWLMHYDEEATHARLAALLADPAAPAIAEHGGRIIKNTGDGFLAEFPSAVEAVRAAMYFQNKVREPTIGEAEDRRLLFRVGINIGDVIVEAHDIFGDGVNIARLEGIAEPGGICISSSAYAVDTRGGSVRESRTHGSGRGARGNSRPYREASGCRVMAQLRSPIGPPKAHTPRTDVGAELDEALSSEVIEIELQSTLKANSVSRARHCCSRNFGRSHLAPDTLRKSVGLARMLN